MPKLIVRLPRGNKGILTAQDYSSVRLTNGHGSLSRVGVSLQRGVKAKIDVKFEIETISDQDFKTWFDSGKRFFTSEQIDKLEEGYSAGGFLGGLLCGCFGFLFGGGSYNHYRNSYSKQIQVEQTEKQGFMRDLHDINKSKVEVKGSIEAEGIDWVPVEGFVFVETTTIEFADEKRLTVISSSSPVVAAADGDTTHLRTGPGTLAIVPINS